MKNKKIITAVLACALSAACVASMSACNPVEPEKPHTAITMDAAKTKIVVQGYEWGPAVPKVIVEFKGNVSGVTKDTFAVKMSTNRTVTDAYTCDENGNKVTTASKYVAIEMSVKYGEASPFSWDNDKRVNVWNNSIPVTVKINKNNKIKVGDKEYLDGDKFDYTVTATDRNVPQTASWKKDTYKYEEGSKKIDLSRASWAPSGADTDNQKNPLIIWLHGGGEGGTDIDIALLGNEVTALTSENETNVQHYFKTGGNAGAYVLAVQSPTMWMDEDGNGNYGGGEANTPADGKPQNSYYTEALWGAITDYVDNNEDIDPDRIYIGGCSNGGYMTMNLAFEHPDYFAAYYPVCEGYKNENVSDEMLAKIKDCNIWFLLSEADNTLKPDMYTIPLYYRLLQAGAENVHLTYKKNVTGVDDPNPSSGWGTPGYYDGHWSWIYAFNDDVKTEIDNTKVQSQADLTPENCTKEGNMWEWIASIGVKQADPVETDTFEAENGVLSGSEHIQVNEWYGFDTVAVETKTKYTGTEEKGEEVTSIGYFQGENAAITWTVNAEAACEATLTLWAASSVTKTEKQEITNEWGTFPMDVVVGMEAVPFTPESQPVTLLINGTQVTLSGTVTGLDTISASSQADYSYYANYVGTVTATIQLKAGENTIVLKAPAENPKLNIDKIVVDCETKLSYVPVNNKK
ncbi:MAG: prolyl oligopeptidase family serine peptidase [Clostridia bacterium]|nr:prolyl oligopeptidase family serine peptidase [Clostridia bacterium]